MGPSSVPKGCPIPSEKSARPPAWCRPGEGLEVSGTLIGRDRRRCEMATPTARHVPQDFEVKRLSDSLSSRFQQVEPDAIEDAVRDSYERHSAGARVKDFVSIFVERELRRELRAADHDDTLDSPTARRSA